MGALSKYLEKTCRINALLAQPPIPPPDVPSHLFPSRIWI